MPYTGSKAQAGRGSSLLIGATPTPIGEVSDSPLNRGEWQFDDTTNFDSGADKEVISTIRDNGTVPFKGNRVGTDAGQILVETSYQSGAVTAFTLQLPPTALQTTGDKYTFNAFVKGSKFTVETTKKIGFEIDLMITGPTTFVAGTPVV